MEYRNSMMSRMFVLFTLLLIFPAGIILQIVRVGIFHGEGYRDLWSTQAMDFISIPAERGNIYDQKIGRASCRERGWIVVGEVGVKEEQDKGRKLCGGS